MKRHRRRVIGHPEITVEVGAEMPENGEPDIITRLPHVGGMTQAELHEIDGPVLASVLSRIMVVDSQPDDPITAFSNYI